MKTPAAITRSLLQTRHLAMFLIMLGFSTGAWGFGGGGAGASTSNLNSAQTRLDKAMQTARTTENTASSARDASLKAIENLSAARTDLIKARSDLDKTSSRLRSEYDKSPEMVKALDAVKECEATFLRRKLDLLQALKESDPKYKAALTKRDQLEARVKNLNSSANVSNNDDRVDEFVQHMEAVNAVTAFEQDAVSADPQARELKTKLDAAKAVVVELGKKFNATKDNNPDWAKARQAEERAQQNVTAKEKAAKDASDRLADANRANIEARAAALQADSDLALVRESISRGNRTNGIGGGRPRSSGTRQTNRGAGAR